MCVRYTLHKSDAALAAISRALKRQLAAPDWAVPRYNVTLTQTMPVVAAGDEGPELRRMLWGLLAFFEREKTQPKLLPNAKAETAQTLPAFKNAVAKRRCLVPANGFYEWKTAGRLKLPHVFMLQNETPFAFAGIWEPGTDAEPANFSILTTEPNALVAPIHNRMPVILTEETMARWLGREPLATDEYQSLVRPLNPARMTVRPVSRYVSSTRNEGPECLAPPPQAEPELQFE